jgi:hypothetical protein
LAIIGARALDWSKRILHRLFGVLQRPFIEKI